MTRRLKKRCKDKAVYWPPGAMSHSGQAAPGDPVQLLVRWEDHNEQFLDHTGNLRMSKARIFSPVPVENLGFLWKGDLEDADPDPVLNADALEVRRVDTSPDRNANEFLYTIYL